MKSIFLTLCTTFICLSVFAQTPTLVEDIWPGAYPKESWPTSIRAFGDRLIFSAFDSAHANELWEWEQMSKPAKRITDNGNTSYSGCVVEATGRIGIPIFIGNALFTSQLSPGSRKMLRYHPTGTIDTLDDDRGVDYSSLSIIGSKAYYFTDTIGTSGNLWSYDGINPPVRLKFFKKIVSGGNWLPEMIAYNGKLYFGADSTGLGTELFSFDPATSVLSLVADIYSGSKASWPRAFTVAGNKLYFTATDSAHGEELYSYDGSAVKRLTDILSGPTGSFTYGANQTIHFHKGGVFFSGYVSTSSTRSALYRYDTATGIAAKVYDPYPTDINGYPEYFLSTPNNLYFVFSNGLSTNPGKEIHKFNGTTYSLVADLNPGHGDGVNSNLELWNGYVYFAGNNGATGLELYRLKDSATGSAVVQALNWNGAVVAYPNPATSNVTFAITLPSAQSLRLVLSDMPGREVWASAVRNYPTGKNEVSVPMQSRAVGQYFYRLLDDKGQTLASGSLMKQ